MIPELPEFFVALSCFRSSGNANYLHSYISFKYLFPPQYLAILFFQKDYKSFWDDLPGVEDDEKELTEVLKSYQKRFANNSEDVLKDLRKILQDNKQKEFKRIHFHYSGRKYYTFMWGNFQSLVLIPVPNLSKCSKPQVHHVQYDGLWHYYPTKPKNNLKPWRRAPIDKY